MRVVIVEDRALLREGLARLFTDGGHEVAATLRDAATVGHVVDVEKPDLVVLDIRMPPTYTDEGARAALEIKDAHPEVGVLALSERTVEAHVRHVLLKLDAEPSHRRADGDHVAGDPEAPRATKPCGRWPSRVRPMPGHGGHDSKCADSCIVPDSCPGTRWPSPPSTRAPIVKQLSSS